MRTVTRHTTGIARCAKAIRALPEDKYQKLPIIALTANAMVDARKEFLNAGMNGFVAKPIDFARICNQLKLWLPKDLVRDVPKEEAKKLLADDLSDREIQPEDPQMGFSFEEGVKHCGSKAALMKTIRIFYRTIDSKANKIEQCLKEGLIGDYVIEVHALKSSALLIGAVPLSEAAKEDPPASPPSRRRHPKGRGYPVCRQAASCRRAGQALWTRRRCISRRNQTAEYRRRISASWSCPRRYAVPIA